MTPPDNHALHSGRGIDWDALPYGGDLFGEMYLAELTGATQAPDDSAEGIFARFLPGLVLAAVAAGSAAWLAEHYGFPIILLGLLIGLALNFVAREETTHLGLDFASRTCLRWGIVALGFQVTLTQMLELGPWPFVALLVIMGLTFAAGVGGAAVSGQSRYAGILAGGATAICGASAALALYGIIGRDRLSQAQFALTLVGISLASALAMSLYPAIAGEFRLSDSQAGFLIGASVHDVAQAIGGGFTYWFIVVFILLVGVNSTGLTPPQLQAPMMVASKALLLFAVTATAMRSDMALIIGLGWRAATPILTATVTSFVAAAIALGLGAV